MSKKHLFKLCDNFDYDNNYGLGIQVENITDEFASEDEFLYRIYTSKGNCFQIGKSIYQEDEENIKYIYEFESNPFDGFIDISLNQAVKLMVNTVQL